METAGSRKLMSAARAAAQTASSTFPQSSITVTSVRTDQTRLPATAQSVSTSIAWLLRILRSSRRMSSMACSEGRPGSNASDAIGESSTKNRSCPSVGRSAYGSTNSALTTAIAFVSPRRTSTAPSRSEI
eukprot:scaffold262552_cov31-Tisochrysis_lutea.AAC.2